jgi:hypothetical protein
VEELWIKLLMGVLLMVAEAVIVRLFSQFRRAVLA